MFKLVLFFMMVAIAATSYVKIRKDPRFTARVVTIHLIALALYLLLCGLSTYLLVSHVSASSRGANHILPFLGIQAAVVVGGLVFLARYLKRVLNRSRETPSELCSTVFTKFGVRIMPFGSTFGARLSAYWYFFGV